MTVLSALVWDASDKSKLGELKPYDKPISVASGSLDVKGKVNLLIEIAGCKYAMDVLVASIENDILLGLDCIVRFNCTFDIANNRLNIMKTHVELNRHGAIGCYRVFAANVILLPARSEEGIKGHISGNQAKAYRSYLVEPSEKIENSGNNLVAIAKSLVPVCSCD